jgi:quercetin dioxygenase-like cupin family protein
MERRRVVTGIRDGKEIIVEDRQLDSIDLNGVSLVSIWKLDEAPTVPTDGTESEGVGFPGPGALWVCSFTVPPRTTISYDDGLVEFRPGRPGFHATDTVDVDYILEGEIVLETEDGTEVTLQTGTTIVVNGTGHSWHNRGDVPATVFATVYGATRAEA